MGHIFDPEKLHAIARSAVGLSHQEMQRHVVDALDREWPGHIDTSPRWMFNMTAGATGMMGLLHASLSEYLILFGSAIGTEGFSGRYRMHVWDAMISGEMWTYTESAFRDRVIHRPGDMALLERGDAKAYRICENSWMLEYGRGIIPAAMPLGLADAVLGALDGTTVVKTLHSYGRLVVKELLQGKI